MVIRVADQPRRERGADHCADTVVAREVHRLVAGPEQRTEAARAREPGPHEEDRVPCAAARRYRACVHLRPQGRPGVVRQHAVAPVGKPHVDRQILAEVGHPPCHAQVEHLLPDHAFGKPFRRGRQRKVHDSGFELAKVDQVRLSRIHALGQVPGRRRFGEERSIDRQVRVDVGEKPYVTGYKLSDLLAQPRVPRLIRRPVPEQPLAETRMPDSGPVFAPQPGNGGSGGDDRFHPGEAVQPILQTQDRTRKHPIRQPRRPAEAR